jgi:hypothetical protein
MQGLRPPSRRERSATIYDNERASPGAVLGVMKSIGDSDQLKYRPRPGAAKGERAERPHLTQCLCRRSGGSRGSAFAAP